MSYFWEVEDSCVIISEINELSLGKKGLLSFECEVQAWFSLALNKPKGPKPLIILKSFWFVLSISLLGRQIGVKCKIRYVEGTGCNSKTNSCCILSFCFLFFDVVV